MGKKKSVPLAAGILCSLSLVIMTAALIASGRSGDSAEFTPPPFEQAAMPGTPDVPENLGWGELDVKAFKVSVCGDVVIEDGLADVWLTNPQSNTVWLKLRILDAEGQTLGETGLLHPGEYVQSVAINRTLKAGTSIGLKIMAYEPETYYSEGSATLHTTVTGGKLQ